jgi:GNAT superfamily N-acetyltransferase
LHNRLIRTFTAGGFYPIETTLEPYRKLKGFEYPRRFEHLVLRPVQRGEIPQLLEIARQAFGSDRFHLDTNLPQEAADRRYQYWLENALTAGEHVLAFVDTRQDTCLGFCHLRAGEAGVVEFSLAGLDARIQKAGLGVIMYAQCLLACQELGYSQIVTRISVNNIGVLNIYAHLGFHFRHPTLTLHWYSG